MSKKLKKSKIDDFHFSEHRYVEVTDDWYPCIDGNKISVNLHTCKTGKIFRVYFSVWGGDDFYVVNKYESTSPEQAYSIFKLWKEYIFDRIPDGITVEWFFEHGFYHD